MADLTPITDAERKALRNDAALLGEKFESVVRRLLAENDALRARLAAAEQAATLTDVIGEWLVEISGATPPAADARSGGWCGGCGRKVPGTFAPQVGEWEEVPADA